MFQFMTLLAYEVCAACGFRIGMCGYTLMLEGKSTCLFVILCVCVCMVEDFSTEDKVSGIKFCTVVCQHPVGRESHILGNFAPQKPRSNRPAHTLNYK